MVLYIDNMPISMEQWRAGVGSNNAARSRVMGRSMRKMSPKSLLSQFLSLLMMLFAPWVGLVTEGKARSMCRARGVCNSM